MADRENERLRSPRRLNLHLVDRWSCGEDGMPVMAAMDLKPAELIGWNYVRGGGAVAANSAVHFFLDDYQFHAIWNEPERATARIERVGAALSPDFSVWLDMPRPMQMWNVYRSRAIGSYWQSLGISTIPTLSWGLDDTYDFAFAGVEPGGTVAVSTIGTHRNKDARAIWLDGMQAALETTRPSRVLIYGKPHDWTPAGVEVVHYANSVTERMADGRTRV